MLPLVFNFGPFYPVLEEYSKFKLNRYQRVLQQQQKSSQHAYYLPVVQSDKFSKNIEDADAKAQE